MGNRDLIPINNAQVWDNGFPGLNQTKKKS